MSRVSYLLAFPVGFRGRCRLAGALSPVREDPGWLTGDAIPETVLSARLPDPDPRGDLAARIVREVMDDRTITKVEQLAERTGMSLRQLQRLFRKYVGVSPKWVIKRFRLQEAAERIEQDPATSCTDLALELGYFDQAHFIKDFKAVLGVSPTEYRRGPSNLGKG